MNVRWTKGGEATISALDGDRITLSSTTPSAPGSRIEGSLPGERPLRVKVARCKRAGAAFVIEGRLIDATRVLRAEIDGSLGRSDGDQGT